MYYTVYPTSEKSSKKTSSPCYPFSFTQKEIANSGAPKVYVSPLKVLKPWPVLEGVTDSEETPPSDRVGYGFKFVKTYYERKSSG